MAIRFKVLPYAVFNDRYPRALLDTVTTAADVFGEVNVPGMGWHACLIQNGKPKQFFNEDDDWDYVPDVEFVEVK